MSDLSEILFQPKQDFALGTAAQHFGEERPAGLQHQHGEFERRFRQSHDLEVIGMAMSGRMSRHVGENRIGFLPSERVKQNLRRIIGEEIVLDGGYPRNGLHAVHVDGYDAASAFGRLSAIGRYL